MSRFSIEYTVAKKDCDRNGNLKLSAMLQLFTDAAEQHYEHKGIGREKLESENMRFLLMQTAAKIYRLPKEGEQLTVSTWEIKIDGIYFDRGYEIESAGKKLISGDGHWILTDLAHKILPPKKFPYEMESGNIPDIECKRMPKYSTEDFTSGIIRKVECNEIDINGHVHNTVYADIACDYIPEDAWEKQWNEMHINWRNEARFGDEWELFTLSNKVINTNEYRCIGFIENRHSFDFLLRYENDKNL